MSKDAAVLGGITHIACDTAMRQCKLFFTVGVVSKETVNMLQHSLWRHDKPEENVAQRGGRSHVHAHVGCHVLSPA